MIENSVRGMGRRVEKEEQKRLGYRERQVDEQKLQVQKARVRANRLIGNGADKHKKPHHNRKNRASQDSGTIDSQQFQVQTINSGKEAIDERVVDKPRRCVVRRVI
jgi:hypothetical protein